MNYTQPWQYQIFNLIWTNFPELQKGRNAATAPTARSQVKAAGAEPPLAMINLHTENNWAHLQP